MFQSQTLECCMGHSTLRSRFGLHRQDELNAPHVREKKARQEKQYAEHCQFCFDRIFFNIRYV